MNYGNHQLQSQPQPQPQQRYGGYHRPQQGQSQVQNQFQLQNPQPLPPGWVEATDPNSGKVYYCNPQTGETKWERPTVSPTTNTILQTGRTTTHATTGDPKIKHQQNSQPLPPGWVEARDPSSGKVYYCNPQTRETKWERPSFPTSTPSATPSIPLPTGGHGNSDGSENTRTDFMGGNSNSQSNSQSNSNSNLVVGGNNTHHGTHQSMTPLTTATPSPAIHNNNAEDQELDELRCMTTGQIAHLIKLRQRQQKEELSALAEEERQVDLSTIVTNQDTENASALDRFKYAPIEFSMMSMLSATDRTEPGRLDVRMYALREELKKFGYQKSLAQPQPYR
mmetsp:Transcript_23048/g.54405  ORF Transcript_23048/g.54405 Transcript_23048/m.54405 type:complete len:337 (+) Transcript_23048:84-1094(+)